MSSAVETNRCRLPGEGVADTGPPPRSLPLPRDIAPLAGRNRNSLGNIFRLFKNWLMLFPTLRESQLIPPFYPRRNKFAAGCPAEGAADPGPQPGELVLTPAGCPPAGGTGLARENVRLFKNWLMISLLVNEFCSGRNSLPAARGKCCRHRTTTQKLALTPARCTPAGGTEFPRENFRLFKNWLMISLLVNEFSGRNKSLPAARRRCCRHRTTTQETCPYTGTLHPGRRNRIPPGIFSTF